MIGPFWGFTKGIFRTFEGRSCSVFTAPPNEWWAVIEQTDRDWRPTLVAVLMVPLYIAILYYPWSRNLFSIQLLTWWQYLIIGIAVVAWAFGLRYSWKNKVFDRFFGYR